MEADFFMMFKYQPRLDTAFYNDEKYILPKWS